MLEYDGKSKLRNKLTKRFQEQRPFHLENNSVTHSLLQTIVGVQSPSIQETHCQPNMTVSGKHATDFKCAV
jgi:hypothetical protein